MIFRFIWSPVRRIWGGILSDAAIYGLGNAAAAVLPLVVLPVLTRNLSVEEYGLYANMVACVAVLVPFANLGLSNVIARDYIHRNEIDYARVVSTCMFMSAVCMVIIAVALFGIALLAPHLLAGVLGRVSVPLVVSVLVVLAAQAVLPSLLAIYSMARKPLVYVAVRIINAAMFAAAALFVAISLSGGGVELIVAKAATDALLLGFSIVALARFGLLVPRISVAEGARCLSYSLPLVPQMVAGAAIGAMDRMIITYLLGTGAAGIYSVGHQIGMVMWLVVNSSVQAWQPWFYQQMKEGTEEARRRTVRRTYLLVAGWTLIAGLLWLASPFAVDLLVGESYREARRVTPWIITAFLFQGLYSLASAYLYYSGHTGRLAIAALMTTAVQAALTFLLTRANGIVGAAQAVALAYLLFFVLVLIAVRSTVRMPWLDAVSFGNGKS